MLLALSTKVAVLKETQVFNPNDERCEQILQVIDIIYMPSWSVTLWTENNR